MLVFFRLGVPEENRTPDSSVRGWRPGPLDYRDNFGAPPRDRTEHTVVNSHPLSPEQLEVHGSGKWIRTFSSRVTVVRAAVTPFPEC